MTLEELIAVKPTMRTFGMVAWTEMAVEMLLQQAEQIEQLGRWKSTHAPRIAALEGLLATTQRQVSTSREAAQMLESERQANAILTAENEALLKANRDCMDNFNALKTDYDALKADAERLDLLESTFFAKRWNGVLDSGSRTTWCIVPGYHSTHSMVGHTFRAAIDAMKGAT